MQCFKKFNSNLCKAFEPALNLNDCFNLKSHFLTNTEIVKYAAFW